MAAKDEPEASSTRASYHHGDLREALIRRASELVARDGVAGFRLREAARSLGVDSASVYRHYRNRSDLLMAVADRAVDRFTDELDAARSVHEDGAEQLHAVALGYVRFAEAHPHLFRLVFSTLGVGPQLSLRDNEKLPRPGQLFLEVIEHCRRTGVSDLSFRTAGVLTWTGIHGLACLAADGLVEADGIERHTREVTLGILRSLRRPRDSG